MKRSPWRVRRARADEIAELTRIAHRAKAHWNYPQAWLESWRDDLTFTPDTLATSHVYVAAKGRQLGGVIATTPSDGDWEIEHLWVLPDHMSQGLGRRLLVRALTDARRAGAATRLLSDPGALGFYQHHGGEHVDDAPSSIPGRTLPVVLFLPDTQRRVRMLLRRARRCDVCQPLLPLGPRPVVRLHQRAPVLIVGQAPGTRVHETGIPWNDPSGDRLRDWLQVSRECFYDPRSFAIAPAGFCYPGKGKSGDLPPRPECAPLWQPQVLDHLPNLQVTLLVGQYAQRYHLGDDCAATLTATVQQWREYLPRFIPLPHPSPRNQLWLRRNPWFADDVLPALRARVRSALKRAK